MKKILTITVALLWGLVALGQTAQQIVARMEAAMPAPEVYRQEGLALTMDMKIPILGTTTSTAYTLGERMYVELRNGAGEVQAYTWRNPQTTWTYLVKDKRIEITNTNPVVKDSNSGDVEMFKGVTDGYDVSIKKETADAWYILCKKSKSNTKKDDPATMELVVAKGTYAPVSLSSRVAGIAITLRDIQYGVTEDQVTFDKSKYPNVVVVDKRLLP